MTYFWFGSDSFGFGSVQIVLGTGKYPEKFGFHLVSVPVWIGQVVRIIQ